MELGRLRLEFPEVPIAALTATATPETIAVISNVLRLRDPVMVVAESFNRCGSVLPCSVNLRRMR